MGKNIFLGLVALLILAACSNNSNPVSLGSLDENLKPGQPSISESNYLDEGVNQYRGVFGAWKVIIDPDTLTAEIEPARNAEAIGLIVDADLSQFLTVSPCHNCLRIASVQMDPGSGLVLGIGMRHPFTNAAARPDLHGFDVRLIFVLDDAYGSTWDDVMVMPPDGIEVPVEHTYSTVLNADGFTSHWDNLVTDSRYFQNGSDVPGNINPFIRYFEDFSDAGFDPSSPTGHNVMRTGSDFETQYAVIGGETVMSGIPIYLIADVAYGQSAVFANRNNPQYYLPAFHRTEPWRMEYWIENNFLDFADPTSTVDVVVQVFDWQQGATVDPGYPNPANLSGIPESSNVLRVELSVPHIQDDPIVVTANEGGTGRPSDPLQYRLTVTNQNLSSGSTTGLLAIRDELYGHTGRLPIPDSPAGFPYSTLDILDYSYYQLVKINYPDSRPYNYNGEFEINESEFIAYGGNTELNGRFFMDPGGRNFQYTWDYNYDGSTFDIDGTGMPSPYFALPNIGRNDVGLRVQTTSVPPREYTYTLPVYVPGVDFSGRIETSAGYDDAFAYSRGAAIAMTDDRYYVAYTSEAGGKRDIWLAVGDRNGAFTTQNLTSSLGEQCYFPSIVVVNNGIRDGVYIVFNRYAGPDWDLYSIYGNLDGSSFLPANIKPVAATLKYNAFAEIEYAFDRLLVYYWTTDNAAVSMNIGVAYSEDSAQTWNIHPTYIGNSSTKNVNPTATYNTSSSRMYVFWEDYTNDTVTSSDLYMAQSYMGLDFTDVTCISSLPGLAVERDAQATSYYGVMALAYKAKPVGATEEQIRLKLIDIYNNVTTDQPITLNTYNCRVSRPSVSFPFEDKIGISYATRDITTGDMYFEAVDVYLDTTGLTDFRQETILHSPIGNMPAATLNYYGVGIASRPLIDKYAVEHFVVCTDFTAGSQTTVTPFPYEFGKISYASVITQGRSPY
jgi:hypothetical protein